MARRTRVSSKWKATSPARPGDAKGAMMSHVVHAPPALQGSELDMIMIIMMTMMMMMMMVVVVMMMMIPSCHYKSNNTFDILRARCIMIIPDLIFHVIGLF